MLKVLEMYKCVQGEGSRIGEPSLLVRFFGCNALCAWCDTKYSINPKLHAELGGPPIKIQTVAKVLEDISLFPKWSMMLTGGEPTLQPQADLQVLLHELLDQNRWVTVETNGTIYVPVGQVSKLDFYDKLLWSLSPKLPGAQTDAWDEDVMRQYCQTYRHVQFKFVIDSERDWNQVRVWYEEEFYTRVTPDRVFLQPNGYDIRPYADKLKELNDWVLDAGLGFRVLPQLHVLTYGQKRLV